ncbi:endoplasmic reticulum retention protein [Perkinsus olseni]|uniref:Endoplasmic reticulum retention protein n=1 Tax=Perkinsus olseni TaxID=32597 RepID=A0A7J6NL74_PEROL|nr:endoplasmic reticulum retention protein [Perkinsus olseni]
MNIFRFCGDMLHLLSILLLVLKLQKSKSCVGISCKMQEMYAMVFIFRYVDLLWLYVSLYNTGINPRAFFVASCAADLDTMDYVYLDGVRRHFAAVVAATASKRGRELDE